MGRGFGGGREGREARPLDHHRGISTTTIEFRLEINRTGAVNDVKDAISKIRINLPRTIDEPIISRVEIAGLPIMIYGPRRPP